MLDLFSFMYGIVAVLMVESIVLMFATEWLRKKVRHGREIGQIG